MIKEERKFFFFLGRFLGRERVFFLFFLTVIVFLSSFLGRKQESKRKRKKVFLFSWSLSCSRACFLSVFLFFLIVFLVEKTSFLVFFFFFKFPPLFVTSSAAYPSFWRTFWRFISSYLKSPCLRRRSQFYCDVSRPAENCVLHVSVLKLDDTTILVHPSWI